MLNGPLFCGTTRLIPGLALDRALSTRNDDRDRIDQLYLLTLSRLPTESEIDHWLKFVSAENPIASTKLPPENDRQTTAPAPVMPSTRIINAPPGSDFSELLKQAKSGADFKVLYAKMKNNADAGQYVRALREFAAEAPFRSLVQQGGGRTPKEQAYEDLHWALLNCSEFLTNH
jgi:hypothetical protein